MTELAIQVDAIVDFLVGLLNTPSPTGYHDEAVAYVREAFTGLGLPDLTIDTLHKGALCLTWPGQAADAPRGLTAHIDTLGLMVRAIKPSGRLKVTNLGGIMWSGIEFEGVTIRTFDNRRYRGTIVPVNPSVHVNKEIHTVQRNGDTMEIRLDERVQNEADVCALGIGVGDFVFLDPRVEVVESGFIRARFLDDKAGVAAIYGALLALAAAGQKPAQHTTILITNYEEVGHGGAVGFPPGLSELLVVDMAAMGEDQASDEFSVSVCVKDGSGPYHFAMNNKLRRLAERFAIPCKVDIYPYYSSDGSAFWRAGGDAQVGLVGPGVDASHSYERTHRDALEHSAHLLARYLLEAG